MKEKRDFRNCRNCRHINALPLKHPCHHCKPTLKNKWQPEILKLHANSK